LTPRLYSLTNLYLTRRFTKFSKSLGNRITFLFFYSRGYPFDKGFNLEKKALEIRLQLRPYFDQIIGHNKQTLKSLPGSENYCNEHEIPLVGNPNANFFGYFDFKPFIIFSELNKLGENEVLLYHDGNFEKNPQYWESDWQNIQQICDFLLNTNKTSIWVQFERGHTTVNEHVKEHCLDYFFSSKEKAIVKKSRLLNAARILIKNDENGRKFAKTFLEHCSNPELIGPNPVGKSDSIFRWSCGDQDVLNCLIYRMILDGELPSRFPMYSFFYRVLRIEDRSFTWDIDGKAILHRTGIYLILNSRLIVFMQLKKVRSFFYFQS
jgi:hypothetical protein